MRKNLFISAVLVLSSMMLAAQNKNIQHGFQVEFGLGLVSGSNTFYGDPNFGRVYAPDKTDHTNCFLLKLNYNARVELSSSLYFNTGLGYMQAIETIRNPLAGTKKPSSNEYYMSQLFYYSNFLFLPLLLEYMPTKFFSLEGGFQLASNLASWNGDNGRAKINKMDFPIIEPDVRLGFKLYFKNEIALGFHYNHGLFPYNSFSGPRYQVDSFEGVQGLKNYRNTLQLSLSKYF